MMISWWSKYVGVILSVLICDIWINVLLQTSVLVGPLHIGNFNTVYAFWGILHFYCRRFINSLNQMVFCFWNGFRCPWQFYPFDWLRTSKLHSVWTPTLRRTYRLNFTPSSLRVLLCVWKTAGSFTAVTANGNIVYATYSMQSPLLLYVEIVLN
jgi:hypothetical protein